MQGLQICMWVELMPSDEKYHQEVFIIGTGYEVPSDAYSYIGTVQDEGLVWHVYAGEYEIE